LIRNFAGIELACFTRKFGFKMSARASVVKYAAGMQTTISTKGNVQVPDAIRGKLGLKPGDALDADIEAGNIVLKPWKKKKYKTRIVRDPITGPPALDSGPNAPVLTNEMVRDLLADFP